MITDSIGPKYDPKLASRAKLRLLRHDRDIAIYLVDGEFIRDNIFQDYVCGGTRARYNFMPPNEVWIEVTLSKREREATIRHELHERSRMLRGESYNHAHDAANVVERRWRLINK